MCLRLRSGDKHHLRKSEDRRVQISPVSGKNAFLILCFSICRISLVVFIPRAQNHAQSLFLFPIVFGIHLIHCFDVKKDGAAGNSIALFRCFDPWSRHLTEAKRRTRTVSKSATFLTTESVNSAPFKRGETKVQVLARKGAKLFANTKVESFGKERCKIHRQFQLYLGDVTSVSLCISLSLSFSLSLSLSPSAPHAQYRKRFRASYNKGSSLHNRGPSV